jgi:hypothetical protein
MEKQKKSEYNKKYYLERIEQQRERHRKYYSENSVEKNKRRALSYASNPEMRNRRSEYVKNRRSANPEIYKEYAKHNYVKIKPNRKAYLDANREKLREQSRKRYAKKPDLHAQQAREWRNNNRESVRAHSRIRYHANKEEISAMRSHERKKYRARMMVAAARTRSRQRHLPFDLNDRVREIQERINTGVCEASGVSFNLETGQGRLWNSPSLDRIVPSLGYVYSNIRIVLWVVNAAKGEFSDDVVVPAMKAWAIMHESKEKKNAL